MAGVKRNRWWLRVALFFVIIVCPLSGIFYWSRTTTHLFSTVQEKVLYCDGGRSKREFKNAVRKAGAKTVVFVHNGTGEEFKFFEDAQKELKSQGVTFISIYFRNGDWPANAQISVLIDAVNGLYPMADGKLERPVLLHAAAGFRRTAILRAAYQMSVMNWTKNQTRDALKGEDLDEGTLKDVVEFIGRYDPATRTMIAPAATAPATTGPANP